MLPGFLLFWLVLPSAVSRCPQVLRLWDPGHCLSFSLDPLPFILPSLALLTHQPIAQHSHLASALGRDCLCACSVTVANPLLLSATANPSWDQGWPFSLLLFPLPFFSCRVSGVSQHQCQGTGQWGTHCAYELVSPFVSEHSWPFFWPLSLGGCVGLGLALGLHGLLLVWLLYTASKAVLFKDHFPRHGAVLCE